MNIQLQGIRYDLTEADRNLVDQRIGKLDRFLTGGNDEPFAQVDLERVEGTKSNNKDIFRVEASIEYAGRIYRAEETRRSLDKAVTDVMNKLSKQIRGEKQKRDSLMKRGGKKIREMMGK